MSDYAISGPFGMVQLAPSFKQADPEVVDGIRGAGWHQVNELYRIDRPSGSPTFLLLFTVAGCGRAYIGDQRYTLCANQALIIPPHIPSGYRAQSFGSWTFYWLHLDGAHADAVLTHLMKSGGNCHTFPLDGLCSLMQMILRADCRYPDSDLYASVMVSRVLHEMMYAVRAAQTESVNDAHDELVWNLIRDMEAHCDQPLNLSQLSARYYLSKEHLIRIFHKKTGTTPYKFFRRYKMMKSTQLLIYTDQPIKEIAVSLGYSDLVSYSIQFKKEFGVSPSAYRSTNKVYQN